VQSFRSFSSFPNLLKHKQAFSYQKIKIKVADYRQPPIKP